MPATNSPEGNSQQLQDDLESFWAVQDLKGATALRELLGTLRKEFATGAAKVGDFPATRAALDELAETFEAEAAVEKRLELQARLSLDEEEAGSCREEAAGTEGGGARKSRRRVCVMVDGSLQAATALKWAVENLVGPEIDHLWLVNVIPWEAFSEDSGRILAEAWVLWGAEEG